MGNKPSDQERPEARRRDHILCCTRARTVASSSRQASYSELQWKFNIQIKNVKKPDFVYATGVGLTKAYSLGYATGVGPTRAYSFGYVIGVGPTSTYNIGYGIGVRLTSAYSILGVGFTSAYSAGMPSVSLELHKRFLYSL